MIVEVCKGEYGCVDVATERFSCNQQCRDGLLSPVFARNMNLLNLSKPITTAVVDRSSMFFDVPDISITVLRSKYRAVMMTKLIAIRKRSANCSVNLSRMNCVTTLSSRENTKKNVRLQVTQCLYDFRSQSTRSSNVVREICPIREKYRKCCTAARNKLDASCKPKSSPYRCFGNCT